MGLPMPNDEQVPGNNHALKL